MLYVNMKCIPRKIPDGHSNFGIEEARWRSWGFVVVRKFAFQRATKSIIFESLNRTWKEISK